MKLQLNQAMTLIEALMALSPSSSMTTLRSWLKEGRVEVDGKIYKIGNQPIEKGQTVRVLRRRKLIGRGIEILYSDKQIIVIDKPAGLLSVSTAFETEQTVHKILKRHLHPKEVYVVHRLDQETSGVMLFALSEETQTALKEIFEKHEIERCYAAIVEGEPKLEEGSWSSYLYEDANYHVHSTPDPKKGKRAITHYRVVNRRGPYAWLDLKLETGKKNQIRVHCQDAGYPVAGDLKYGAKTNPVHRVCLHAYHLGFQHPHSKQMIRVSSPPPKSFSRLVPNHKKNEYNRSFHKNP